VINLSDYLGWISGNPLVFPDVILDTITTSEQGLVVDNLTDLIIFYNLSTTTKFVRKFRQYNWKKTKLIVLLHKNCLPLSDVTDLKKQLLTSATLKLKVPCLRKVVCYVSI